MKTPENFFPLKTLKKSPCFNAYEDEPGIYELEFQDKPRHLSAFVKVSRGFVGFLSFREAREFQFVKCRVEVSQIEPGVYERDKLEPAEYPACLFSYFVRVGGGWRGFATRKEARKYYAI